MAMEASKYSRMDNRSGGYPLVILFLPFLYISSFNGVVLSRLWLAQGSFRDASG
jgi:hypothetical protein